MIGVRGIVLDMEGVLHVDWSPIAGSAGAVAELAAAGIALGVLTNTTGKTRAAISERLAGIGYELPVERITTAASAAADHLRSEHAGDCASSVATCRGGWTGSAGRGGHRGWCCWAGPTRTGRTGG